MDPAKKVVSVAGSKQVLIFNPKDQELPRLHHMVPLRQSKVVGVSPIGVSRINGKRLGGKARPTPCEADLGNTVREIPTEGAIEGYIRGEGRVEGPQVGAETGHLPTKLGDRCRGDVCREPQRSIQG